VVALIQEKQDAIVELCRRYGVVRLDVFGSALRDDYRPEGSDIDLLVDFSDRDPMLLRRPTSTCLTSCRRYSAQRSIWSWPVP